MCIETHLLDNIRYTTLGQRWSNVCRYDVCGSESRPIINRMSVVTMSVRMTVMCVI